MTDDIEITIDDEQAIIEISKEFITQSLPLLEAKLRRLLFNEGIRHVNIRLKDDDQQEVKKHFTISDIKWLRRYVKTLRVHNYTHVANLLEEEIQKLEKEKDDGGDDEQIEEESPVARGQFKGRPLSQSNDFWRQPSMKKKLLA